MRYIFIMLQFKKYNIIITASLLASRSVGSVLVKLPIPQQYMKRLMSLSCFEQSVSRDKFTASVRLFIVA